MGLRAHLPGLQMQHRCDEQGEQTALPSRYRMSKEALAECYKDAMSEVFDAEINGGEAGNCL
jgi:hypothetical protein